MVLEDCHDCHVRLAGVLWPVNALHFIGNRRRRRLGIAVLPLALEARAQRPCLVLRAAILASSTDLGDGR